MQREARGKLIQPHLPSGALIDCTTVLAHPGPDLRSGVTIVGQRAGEGPALLLLHSNPLTHLSWQRVAPRLARDFTVVVTDLRGYGDSSKSRGWPDHANYSFRRMAQDQVEVMRELGFEEFCLAGDTRGVRTAFRMALDHPDKVLKAAFFDILLNSYHWIFMAQP